MLNIPYNSVKIHNFDWTSNFDIMLRKVNKLEKGSRVLCILPRSGEWVACLLACWHKEVTFIPVDPGNSEERINLLKEISKPHLIIQENRDDIYCLDYPCGQPLAWICYTSGSTGLPKGVMVSFSGVENLIKSQIEMFELDNTSHVLWSMSPGFDASFSDVCVAIFSNATLYPVNNTILTNQNLLFQFINEHKITYADLSPNLAKILSKRNTSLKCVVFGGEVGDPESIRKLSQKMKVVNVYGPTEATVCTSMITCHSNWNQPSIGYTIKDVEYTMQNQELLISGPCLAIGYWNNEEENKKRFITIDNKTWYRTGDRVIYDINTETYIFKGRIDREFKKSGVRISPEEIEWSLQQAQGVKDAKIILRGKNIIAFIEGDDTFAKEKALLLYSTARPNRWISIKKWKRLPSGKADMQWLESHIIESQEAGKLLDILENILGHRPKWSDSFYNTGGDSLSLMNLICSCDEESIKIDINKIASNKPFSECVQTEDKQNSVIDLIKYTDRKIGITGCTGFLGVHLLKELSQYEKNITLFGRGDIENKIKLACEKYGINSIDCKNFQKVEIDLVEDNAKMYDLDILFHCAADTTLGDSIDNAINKSCKISKNILKIAQNSKLIHISTLSLLVSGPYGQNIHTPALELGPWIGCYAQSKAMSEILLSQHHNIVIIRPSLITGGKQGLIPEHDLFRIAFEACKETYTIPNQEGEISAIDVETVAESIRILSFAQPGIYPLAPDKNITISELSKIAGFKKVKKWKTKSSLGKLAFSSVISHNDKNKIYDLFLATKWNLSSDKTNKILKQHGILLKTSANYLSNTISFLLNQK